MAEKFQFWPDLSCFEWVRLVQPGPNASHPPPQGSTSGNPGSPSPLHKQLGVQAQQHVQTGTGMETPQFTARNDLHNSTGTAVPGAKRACVTAGGGCVAGGRRRCSRRSPPMPAAPPRPSGRSLPRRTSAAEGLSGRPAPPRNHGRCRASRRTRRLGSGNCSSRPMAPAACGFRGPCPPAGGVHTHVLPSHSFHPGFHQQVHTQFPHSESQGIFETK